MKATSARLSGGGADDTLDDQAAILHRALVEFVRVYQFRDRDHICCHDVSVTQCYALDVLIRRDHCTVNELASDLYLDKSTASRVVAALERKKYVVRTRHPGDQRAVLLAATPAGRQLHTQITAALIAEQRQILAGFSPEVRTAAAALIRCLTDAVREKAGAGLKVKSCGTRRTQ